MNLEINRNIKKMIENLGVTPYEFSKSIGNKRADNIYNIINKSVEVSAKTLNKIFEKYPQYKDFVLNGNAPSEIKINVVHNRKTVPLLPIEAIAGFPNDNTTGIQYSDCEQYNLIPEFERSGVQFVIRVSGSSMYPKYSNGDILACKKVEDILFFQWGKVYVIDSSQGTLVKRIFEDNDNPENIILVSDNKDNYPPFPMPKNDIRSLSIVLGVIRME